MTKEQLNKIDEEFGIIKLLEDLITVVSDTDILDTDDVENFYRNEDRIINSQKIDNAWKALNLKGKLASIFHSKLQEAYELGREEAYNFLTQQYEVSKRIEDRIRKDERERIIEVIEKIDIIQAHTHSSENAEIYHAHTNGELAMKNKIINELKSLQTNNTNI